MEIIKTPIADLYAIKPKVFTPKAEAKFNGIKTLIF